MARAVVKPTALQNEFAEKTVTFRGRTFRLRELSIGDYDAITKQATKKDTDETTGITRERLDESLQSRLMLGKSMIDVDPPLPESGIPGLGTRVIVHLNRIVNELHYGEEPDETTKNGAAPPAEADGEGEGEDDKGEASPPVS